MLSRIAVWVLIAFVLFTVFRQFDGDRQMQGLATDQTSYTQFMADAKAGKISRVDVQGRRLTVRPTEGMPYTITSPGDLWMVDDLRKNGVQVYGKAEDEPSFLQQIFVSWFPMLLLIGVWVFFMRQMQGGKGSPFSFGKSKARVLDESANKVRFSDVAGCDEAKQDVQEVVDFLKDPTKYSRLGGHIPRGVLLVGPPGTGKTLLAKAIAGEAGVPFFSISGSDFVEMFVGVGAARVRDMFENAKKNAPCIIFIDEIDAVGRQRGAAMGGNDEREQTLNQMLVQMDGFETGTNVIVIAATNRPDVLDQALLRPGRFDRQVVVPLPDIRGREQILNVHMKKVPVATDVQTDVIARGTPGFSGADLANLVNEAALFAARRNGRVVSMADFELAKDKIMMGAERKSMVMNEDEKKNTAYHESGHALDAKLMPKSDPVHKVTIIPRGRALGVTMQLPEGDRHGYSKAFLQNNLMVLLAGRVAEEIIFDTITTGAGNDIERATGMARKMVCEWGMSDVVGPMTIGEQGEEVFIGRDWGHARNTAKTPPASWTPRSRSWWRPRARTATSCCRKTSISCTRLPRPCSTAKPSPATISICSSRANRCRRSIRTAVPRSRNLRLPPLLPLTRRVKPSSWKRNRLRMAGRARKRRTKPNSSKRLAPASCGCRGIQLY